MKKRCSRCKKIKTITSFCKNKCAKDGFSYWCKTCSTKYRVSPLGKKSRQLSRRKQLLKQYDLTTKQYNEMFQKQQGCCAICEAHQSKLNRRLFVDHNHKTGKIRGLLCMSCNIFLGHLEKNNTLLNRALKYLK